MYGAQHALIGKDVPYASKNGSTAAATSPVDLDIGAIGIYKHTGTELRLLQNTDTYPDVRTIYFAQGRKGYPVISKGLDAEHILTVEGRNGVQGVDQKWAIGYNGSTGSIDTFADEYYSLHIVEHAETIAKSKRETYDHTTPISGATASGATAQYNIAHNFARQINGDVGTRYKSASDLVRAKVIHDGTNTQIGTNLELRKGSELVVAGTNVTNLSNPISIGTSLQIEGDVFQVQDIRGNNNTEIVLDRTYAFDDQIISANTADTGIVSSATAYGILTVNIGDYPVFITSDGGNGIYAGGFAATPVTEVTAFASPVNHGSDIKQSELISQGYFGREAFDSLISNTPNTLTDVDEIYHTATLTFQNFVKSQMHPGFDGAKLSVIIAFPDAIKQGSNTTIADFESALDDYLASIPRQLGFQFT